LSNFFHLLQDTLRAFISFIIGYDHGLYCRKGGGVGGNDSDAVDVEICEQVRHFPSRINGVYLKKDFLGHL